MNKRLSPTMLAAVEMIRAGGGIASPEGGGWWKDGNGVRMHVPNVWANDGSASALTTPTIYSLAARGVLKRLAVHKEPWRDSYALADYQNDGLVS